MKKLLLAGLLSLFCSLAADITDTATGSTFPDKVAFDFGGVNYNLQATGVATRKKLIVKVYSVAHYLQEGATGGDIFSRILNDDYAKQLTIKWAHDATAEQIQGGYKDSLKSNIPEKDAAALQPDVDKFIALFNEPQKKGDEYSLRWIPGGVVEKVVAGKVVGTVTNKAFAKALWNIWFGDKSVVDRNKLAGASK